MTPMTQCIDMTDVPAVSTRELVVAVKLLALHGVSLETAHTLADSGLRNVFAAYWDLTERDASRKTATLVRLQNLIAVCQSRRLSALLSAHGRTGAASLIAAAATCRLNVSYGFNPLKLARSAQPGTTAAELSRMAA